MRREASRPIVIAAGGTGGHFFPAEALAAELIERGERIVLLTDARSGALASMVFAKTEKHVVAGAGLAGRSAKRAIQGMLALARGTIEARAILRGLKPGAIVAFGGYPSVPPILAAISVFGAKPLIILHEQNAVLGRANRFLSRFADILAVNFPLTQRLPARMQTIVVGNPVRPTISDLYGQGYIAPDKVVELLVVGGSLGAKAFSSLVPEALTKLPENFRVRLRVMQQCRAEDIEAVHQIYNNAGIQVELSPFFKDVAALLKRAHLIIARAGASTVTEIAVAGRPAIFIPLPNSIDGHQRINADVLAEHGGAARLDQAGLTSEILAKEIETFLMNPGYLVEMASASARMGEPNAAARLADLIQERVNA
ncbi:MAG: undecaprenyldiphospho-muramoylpentapeptide beta-N-acetylglucosaminyltransferase [Rhodospirillales bacterium]|nr:undecaprenyldiphospho-muramoylpentapeptide beta-N-acetylglucosaminyltransferase [Rhodospirillales bacterium]MDE2319326.1 undecaprenyldiphospho-muramoylpentapeptide beta-N-acetylglucosaminyltransferase [Rhodospirillales bacterium]